MAVVVLALPLGACKGTRSESEIIGALVGAAVGGFLGAQFGTGAGKLAAVAIGTLLGANVGNRIGRRLDRLDRKKAKRAQYSALEHQPDHARVEWRNPDTGHYGSVMATSTVTTRSGQLCREFQQAITVEGRTQRAYGRACRGVGGQWRIAN